MLTFCQFYCKINRKQSEISAQQFMFETLINTSNIELKIWRKNPGGEAFWDSFKFPWQIRSKHCQLQ